MLKLAGEFGIAESELDARIADQIDLHEASLDPHLVETLPVLLKGGNLLHIPTNTGWTSDIAGSGSSGHSLTYIYAMTGVTANSRGLLSALMNGFQGGGEAWNVVNWDKKLYLIFNLRRRDSDSEAVARFQWKSVNTEGALSNKGIGIRADNLALKGESYGTEIGVVDLGTTLVSDRQNQIVIIHYPASKIEWYVNGTLKGTQSTLAKIPSGTSASYLASSIVNGATGGVSVLQGIMHPKAWQER